MGFSPSWEELKLMGQQILGNIAPAMTPDQFATSPFKETVDLAGHSSAFVREELAHHLVDIAEILFFLFGAMTIVEVTEQHHGFTVITNRITTTSKVKLIWVIGIITFFMSAVLDNLTTTIVMIALLRKLISDKPTRWIFASMIVIAANAGGAWSPIGDVTTIMLWIGGQITTVNIILKVFIPSLLNMIVPLTILSFMVRGEVKRPERAHESADITTPFERTFILILGVSMLLFVPVFKTITHLPPYMGMLFGLGILWLVSEIMHRDKEDEIRKKLTIYNIVKKVDTPTIFFFLGILSAVAAL
ncbi:sodium:proton antiporter, partial [bacterium]|nr:sodium:proton antiporter [bacterium]